MRSSARERAGHERYLDLLERLLGGLDSAGTLEGEEERIEHARVALPAHGEYVVEVHVHHVVGVLHRGLPGLLDGGRQLRGSPDVHVDAAEQTNVIRHGLDDAARVLVTEALESRSSRQRRTGRWL